MINILYAAGDSYNSKIQLSRFLKKMEGKPATIKVAAYNNYSPWGRVDWTLDYIKNISDTKAVNHHHEKIDAYISFIKSFKPDLIISDLDYWTSYIAANLNIELWQCSSLLLTHAMPQADKQSGIYNKYMTQVRLTPIQLNKARKAIHYSNQKFAYSHFGDLPNPPRIVDGFKWVRPYHMVGTPSITCQHNLMAGLSQNNKKILELMQRHSDSVVFTEFPNEKYRNIILKDIANEEEYYCNLRNCNLFVSEGDSNLLADAYYNNKFSVVMVNFNDIGCINNSFLLEKRNVCKPIFYVSEDLEKFMDIKVISSYNENIKYLHEWIEEFQNN
jgi:uncharacterized protein (TIGR00661 family)